MKKTITLIMLVVTLLVGGFSVNAKTTKKAKAKTTATKNSSKPAGAIALVKLHSNGKLYLMNNGKVKVTPASWDQDGYYTKSNGAYIMNWGTGTYGDNKISVVTATPCMMSFLLIMMIMNSGIIIGIMIVS